ncbi:MAG: hypothetical protein NTY19_08755 [Planctomycetota bacterium]|nr:hypothetical protein [Planctomycetota bacterium]
MTAVYGQCCEQKGVSKTYKLDRKFNVRLPVQANAYSRFVIE